MVLIFFIIFASAIAVILTYIRTTNQFYSHKMKRDLFRRYVWLVETVRHAKKVQFEEIAERWMESVLNDDKSPFALRTFHNHRHAIESLFGIKIECDRSDHNRYYIQEGPAQNTTRLKEWMLQRLSYSDLDNDPNCISDRIIFDSLPEEKFGIYTIIEGIHNNKVLSMSINVPTSDGKMSLCIAPYCVRFRNSSWFLVGKDIETGIIHTFNLDCVNSITLTDAIFSYPKEFSPAEYFCHTVGVTDSPDKQQPVKVKLRIGGQTRDKVRTFPIHESQKEILTEDDSSVFEYFIVPGEDFHSAVLSHGTDTEVLHPLDLREEIGGKAMAIANRYAQAAVF